MDNVKIVQLAREVCSTRAASVCMPHLPPEIYDLIIRYTDTNDRRVWLWVCTVTRALARRHGCIIIAPMVAPRDARTPEYTIDSNTHLREIVSKCISGGMRPRLTIECELDALTDTQQKLIAILFAYLGNTASCAVDIRQNRKIRDHLHIISMMTRERNKFVWGLPRRRIAA